VGQWRRTPSPLGASVARACKLSIYFAIPLCVCVCVWVDGWVLGKHISKGGMSGLGRQPALCACLNLWGTVVVLWRPLSQKGVSGGIRNCLCEILAFLVKPAMVLYR